MAMDLSIPDLTAPAPLVVALPQADCTPPVLDRLKAVLARHPGPTEVHVRLTNGTAATPLRLSPMRVARTAALMADLNALLGPSASA